MGLDNIIWFRVYSLLKGYWDLWVRFWTSQLVTQTHGAADAELTSRQIKACTIRALIISIGLNRLYGPLYYTYKVDRALEQCSAPKAIAQAEKDLESLPQPETSARTCGQCVGTDRDARRWRGACNQPIWGGDKGWRTHVPTVENHTNSWSSAKFLL